MEFAVKLVRVIDGERIPYSEQQLRNDNPSALLSRGLAGVDLAVYGVEVEPEADGDAGPGQTRTILRTVPPEPEMVPMHCFLWGLRCFNLRTQFEHYMLQLEGHARDFWFSAPYVSSRSTYVRHLQQYFRLSDEDLQLIWGYARGIEE